LTPLKRNTLDKTTGGLVGDDFWDRGEEQQSSGPTSRVHRHRPKEDRLLTRDEITVPDLYSGTLGEWKRDQGFFTYLLLKGAPGRPPKSLVIGTAIVVVICVVIAGILASLPLQ